MGHKPKAPVTRQARRSPSARCSFVEQRAGRSLSFRMRNSIA
jgi:hypothetical protein